LTSAPVGFDAVADPVVSLVVLVYGGHDLALATLASLRASTELAIEVVVVDNASPDGAGERLRSEVHGAEFVMSEQNLGFPAGMDLGVLHTRAPYVGILNSDLQLGDGWLEPLVEALERDPLLGAATPLYLDGEGAVLDGGRLLGADGWGYGFGDRLSPQDPSLSFERRVDFGVAAALLVRREAFDAVGGFDPVYGIGYYEDTDLGFSMRAVGYETAYVPRSVVHHLHGGSFDERRRSAQLARNLPIFLDRHGDALAGRPTISRPPYDPHRELILRDWWAEDRLLVLDDGGGLSALAGEAARALPRGLVTHVGTGPAPTVHAVERATPARLERWLERRRHHYGAVLVHGGLGGEVDRWLDHSQPQARRIRLGGGEPASTRPLLARLGLRPAP
jgi:GT2 family glycosyltransferase